MAAREAIKRRDVAWAPDLPTYIHEAEHMRPQGRSRDILPGAHQSPKFISDWLKLHGKPGTVVVVRHHQLGLDEYLLDDIRRVDLRLKRVYLTDHGSFRLNGEYSAPPRGRFSLLVPTADVLEAALAGRAWMNGRPAFQRPHSVRERALIPLARQQADERS